MKRFLIACVALAVFFVAVPPLSAAMTDRPTIGLVTGGSLGDKAFYDIAHEGLLRVGRELGAWTLLYECQEDPSLYEPTVNRAAEVCDLVFVMGGDFHTLLPRVARVHEDTEFVHIDHMDKDERVTHVSFRDNEGGFLAGVLAGTMTRRAELAGINEENVVGFVGGMDTSVVRNYLAGYEDGLLYVNGDARLLVDLIGSWSDLKEARELADRQYDNGADVILHVAGAAGMGVISAAEERSVWAIGADAAQEAFAPDAVLTSLVKRCDAVVFRLARDFINGTYKRGAQHSYGIAEGGLTLSLWTEASRRNIPPDVAETLRDMEKKIRNGRIKVRSFWD